MGPDSVHTCKTCLANCFPRLLTPLSEYKRLATREMCEKLVYRVIQQLLVTVVKDISFSEMNRLIINIYMSNIGCVSMAHHQLCLYILYA